MRYENVASIRLRGDKVRAQQFIGEARNVVGNMLSANVNELQQLHTRRQLAPGVECVVDVVHGQVLIEIYAEPGPPPVSGACHGFITTPTSVGVKGAFCWAPTTAENWRWQKDPSLQGGTVVWHNDTTAISIDAETRYTARGLGTAVYQDGGKIWEAPETAVGICMSEERIVVLTKSDKLRLYYQGTTGWQEGTIVGEDLSDPNLELKQPILFNQDGTAGVAMIFDHSEIFANLDDDYFSDLDYELLDHRFIFKGLSVALSGTVATVSLDIEHSGLGLVEYSGPSTGCSYNSNTYRRSSATGLKNDPHGYVAYIHYDGSVDQVPLSVIPRGGGLATCVYNITTTSSTCSSYDVTSEQPVTDCTQCSPTGCCGYVGCYIITGSTANPNPCPYNEATWCVCSDGCTKPNNCEDGGYIAKVVTAVFNDTGERYDVYNQSFYQTNIGGEAGYELKDTRTITIRKDFAGNEEVKAELELTTVRDITGYTGYTTYAYEGTNVFPGGRTLTYINTDCEEIWYDPFGSACGKPIDPYIYFNGYSHSEFWEYRWTYTSTGNSTYGYNESSVFKLNFKTGNFSIPLIDKSERNRNQTVTSEAYDVDDYFQQTRVCLDPVETTGWLGYNNYSASNVQTRDSGGDSWLRQILGFDLRCGAVFYTESLNMQHQSGCHITRPHYSVAKLRTPDGATHTLPLPTTTNYFLALPGILHEYSITSHGYYSPAVCQCQYNPVWTDPPDPVTYGNRFEWVFRRLVKEPFAMDYKGAVSCKSLDGCYSVPTPNCDPVLGILGSTPSSTFACNQDIHGHWFVSAYVVSNYAPYPFPAGSAFFNYLDEAPNADPNAVNTALTNAHYPKISVFGPR